MSTQADIAFLQSFEDCSLPKAEFRHQGHLRICWLYLSRYPFDEAAQHVCESIKRFATSLGAAHICHETLTHAWVHIVAQAMKENPSCQDFARFIGIHQDLLDKDLPKQYYSAERLQSIQAKEQWLKPDLKSFE